MLPGFLPRLRNFFFIRKYGRRRTTLIGAAYLQTRDESSMEWIGRGRCVGLLDDLHSAFGKAMVAVESGDFGLGKPGEVGVFAYQVFIQVEWKVLAGDRGVCIARGGNCHVHRRRFDVLGLCSLGSGTA